MTGAGNRRLTPKARRAYNAVIGVEADTPLPVIPDWFSWQQLADFAKIMATPARRIRK